MSDELNKQIKLWIIARNKRGEFGRSTPEDRKLIERETTNEWARSLKTEFNKDIANIRSSDIDPPDCKATIGNRSISIELAELVDSVRLNARVKAVEVGKEPPEYHGEAFENAQWSIDRFRDQLNNLIDRKHEKYLNTGQQFDVLLVHSDETWLLPSYVCRVRHIGDISYRTHGLHFLLV